MRSVVLLLCIFATIATAATSDGKNPASKTSPGGSYQSAKTIPTTNFAGNGAKFNLNGFIGGNAELQKMMQLLMQGGPGGKNQFISVDQFKQAQFAVEDEDFSDADYLDDGYDCMVDNLMNVVEEYEYEQEMSECQDAFFDTSPSSDVVMLSGDNNQMGDMNDLAKKLAEAFGKFHPSAQNMVVAGAQQPNVFGSVQNNIFLNNVVVNGMTFQTFAPGNVVINTARPPTPVSYPVARAVIERRNDSVIVKAASWDMLLAKNDVVAAAFVIAWDGQSRELRRALTSVETMSEVKWAEVDCVQEMSICDRYNVKSVPAFRVFKQGRPFDYSGPINVQKIEKFIQRILTPPIAHVFDVGNLELIASTHEAVFAARLGTNDRRAMSEIEDASRLVPDVTFVILPNAFDSEEVQIPELGHAYLYGRSMYPGFIPFVRDFTRANIVEHIRVNTLPRIPQLTEKNAARLTANGPVVLLISDPATSSHMSLMTEMEVASYDCLHAQFAWLNGVVSTEFARRLGAQSLPSVVWLNSPERHIEHMSVSVMNSEYITDFCQTAINGTHLQPTLAPLGDICAVHNGSFVSVAYRDLPRVIESASCDIMVAFHWTGTGYSDRMDVILTDVASKVKDCVIVRVNCVDDPRSCEEFEIIPSLRLYPVTTRGFWYLFDGDAWTSDVLDFRSNYTRYEKRAVRLGTFHARMLAHANEISAVLDRAKAERDALGYTASSSISVQ